MHSEAVAAKSDLVLPAVGQADEFVSIDLDWSVAITEQNWIEIDHCDFGHHYYLGVFDDAPHEMKKSCWLVVVPC